MYTKFENNPSSGFWVIALTPLRTAGGGRLRRKTITSPDPSDTGDIMMAYGQLDSWEFVSKLKHFDWQNCICRCSLPKWWPSCPSLNVLIPWPGSYWASLIGQSPLVDSVSRMSRAGGRDVAVAMRDCGISTTSQTHPICKHHFSALPIAKTSPMEARIVLSWHSLCSSSYRVWD